MTPDVAPTTARVTSHLRLVTAAESPAAAPVAAHVTPIAAPTAHAPAAVRSGARRPLMERLRPHLPCRSDAAELRATLAALGPSWRMIRGLPDEGVHSLLVGPGGVFALTVQSLANARVAVAGTTVTVDGRPVPLVPQRRLVADNLGRRLSGVVGTDIRVRALVAVIHAQPKWSFCEQPADGRVTVLSGREIAAFLMAQAPVLTAGDIDAITDAAVNGGRPARPALYAV